MKTKTKVLDLNKSTREIRKIDSFEAAHFIFSEKNDCNISIILRLAHSISFSLLKKAVNEIKKRNFLLRCRVNIDPLSFQETEKSPEILFIEKNQERDWESVASYEAHKLFNYQEGPLFRICYLAGKTLYRHQLMQHEIAFK